MQNPSPYRLPLLILVVLLATILAGTAALFGFSSERQAPVPDWIWCSRTSQPGEQCSLSLRFEARRDVRATSLRIAASGPARVQLDGMPIGATGGSGEPADLPIRDLKAGSHELRIDASHGSGTPGICAMVELPGSDRGRVVTDASWQEASAGSGSMASVTATYASGPRPSPFGNVPPSVTEARDARFWVVLLMLMLAMVIACMAGPVLRPPGAGRRDLWVADLAVVFPSILYASAAFVITSLAAADLGTGLIVALHVVSTAVFVLVLIAWKTGTEFIARDQVQHRAELSGYDAMCEAVELLKLDLSSAPEGTRSALRAGIHELAESVRYSSTGTAVPDVDRAILEGIQALRASLRNGGDAQGTDQCSRRIHAVIDRLREREIRLQSGRRA
jgi:hypothetical protein